LKCFCAFPLLLLILCGATSALAQSTDATISGVVVDPAGRVIPGAAIEIVNDATGVHYSCATNGAGIYEVTILPPGQYRVQISTIGFKTLIKPGVVLNVQSAVALNFTLPIGATSESVTVEAGGSTINATDGSVSTVIDRKFVENIPLNGRSFQDLILLTSGAITNSPQLPVSSELGSTGEFGVNGQRTESNYYTVDGVSANTGVPLNSTSPATGGSLPSATALGTTQGLVSVDALQEFRVESSTYSAEYGRNPGGQFSFVTRSGTNDWHGTAFDYFRNDALDANSWFNDNTVPVTKKTAERQNDFGGTLGGPIRIPHLYNGADRSFFFFSYEGLRLVEPSAVTVNAVPDFALRESTTGALQQALNAFPLPTPGYSDLVSGMGQFVGAWSNPAQADATSIRLDHSLGQRIHMFFRFSNTPSSANTRQTSAAGYAPSVIDSQSYASRTYTFGATADVAQKITNDFRLNLSTNDTAYSYTQDSFGGAVPADLFALQGISNSSTEISLTTSFGGYSPAIVESGTIGGQQKQWNLLDDVAVQRGRHALKFGIDWRRLAPTIPVIAGRASYNYFSAAGVAANSVDIGIGDTSAATDPLYTNFSAFTQDEWKVSSRLAVSMGVRWDVNPPPGTTQGMKPYTVIGLDNPATMTLAPQGTPLWKTDWYAIAPRLGIAYIAHNRSGQETVVRGGGGIFFDTGQQAGSYGFEGPGFSAVNYFGTDFGARSGFPVAPAIVTPPIINPPSAPYTYIYANPPHLQLPFTLEWNASLEQAIGRLQSITISYVGANARKLLKENFSNISQVNPDFGYLYIFTNGLTSSYNALQIKYQRQVMRGLQALASYTWSHALDYGSSDVGFPYEHGDSDLDVRHNATAALSYDLPHGGKVGLLRVFSADWGLDARFTARTGFPVTLNGNEFVDPATQLYEYGGLNLVSGAPIYLYGSAYPGGRRINPDAFTLPENGQTGNAPRNLVRGFGALQGDLAIRRSFPIHDRLQGQFRAEAFNISNDPNFGLIGSTCGGAVGTPCSNVQFGLATQILAQSLGNLSPLYQMGGPRSLQLNFKLIW
jgi:hypothetical protein